MLIPVESKPYELFVEKLESITSRMDDKEAARIIRQLTDVNDVACYARDMIGAQLFASVEGVDDRVPKSFETLWHKAISRVVEDIAMNVNNSLYYNRGDMWRFEEKNTISVIKKAHKFMGELNNNEVASMSIITNTTGRYMMLLIEQISNSTRLFPYAKLLLHSYKNECFIFGDRRQRYVLIELIDSGYKSIPFELTCEKRTVKGV